MDLEVEDAVISRWLGGQHVRGISRSLEMTQRAVRDVIDKWTAETVPVDRNAQIARQLGRLDRMLATVLPYAYSTASGGGPNLRAITAACKLITAQCLITGICQPNSAQANNLFVQVNALERQTSTDRIEAALNALIAHRKPAVEAAQVVESEPADVESSDA